MSQKDRVDGYKVEDADAAFEVHVTERDLARGKKKSPLACAIAVAIKRTTGAKQARVNPYRIYVEHDGVYLRFKTPAGIREQVELFDRTGKMGTGIFTIPLVSPSQRLGSYPVVLSRDYQGNYQGKRSKRLNRPVYMSEKEKEKGK